MGIFADSTFRLRGNLPDGSINRLNIKWSEQYHNLSLGARTMGNKYIYANLMPAQVRRLTAFVIELCNKQAEHTFALEIDKSNQLDCKVTVGRDADGILYITFNKPQHDESKYVFLPEKQYRWSENGQAMSNNELSRRSAMDWSQALVAQLDIRMGKVKEEPFESKNGRQGGQKSFGGQQQQQGGQQRSYPQGNGQQYAAPQPQPQQSFDDYIIS